MKTVFNPLVQKYFILILSYLFKAPITKKRFNFYIYLIIQNKATYFYVVATIEKIMISFFYLSVIASSSLFVWFVLSFLEKKSGASLNTKSAIKINYQSSKEITLLKIYKYSPLQIAAAIEEIGKKLSENTIDEVLYVLKNKYGEWNAVPQETTNNTSV